MYRNSFHTGIIAYHGFAAAGLFLGGVAVEPCNALGEPEKCGYLVKERFNKFNVWGFVDISSGRSKLFIEFIKLYSTIVNIHVFHLFRESDLTA